MITQQIVSEKLLAYLDDRLSFNQIITWANQVMREGNFTPDSNIERLVGIIMSLACADQPHRSPMLDMRSQLINQPKLPARVAPFDAA